MIAVNFTDEELALLKEILEDYSGGKLDCIKTVVSQALAITRSEKK